MIFVALSWKKVPKVHLLEQKAPGGELLGSFPTQVIPTAQFSWDIAYKKKYFLNKGEKFHPKFRQSIAY